MCSVFRGREGRERVTLSATAPTSESRLLLLLEWLCPPATSRRVPWEAGIGITTPILSAKIWLPPAPGAGVSGSRACAVLLAALRADFGSLDPKCHASRMNHLTGIGQPCTPSAEQVAGNKGGYTAILFS